MSLSLARTPSRRFSSAACTPSTSRHPHLGLSNHPACLPCVRYQDPTSHPTIRSSSPDRCQCITHSPGLSLERAARKAKIPHRVPPFWRRMVPRTWVRCIASVQAAGPATPSIISAPSSCVMQADKVGGSTTCRANSYEAHTVYFTKYTRCFVVDASSALRKSTTSRPGGDAHARGRPLSPRLRRQGQDVCARRIHSPRNLAPTDARFDNHPEPLDLPVLVHLHCSCEVQGKHAFGVGNSACPRCKRQPARLRSTNFSMPPPRCFGLREGTMVGPMTSRYGPPKSASSLEPSEETPGLRAHAHAPLNQGTTKYRVESSKRNKAGCLSASGVSRLKLRKFARR